MQLPSSVSSSSSSIAPPENRLICLVCQKQFSQYTCPRCNVRYCSLPCYKSHSARCLESFNRDNVLAEMQDCVATADMKKRMMDALKKFHSEGGMDGAQFENMQIGDDSDDVDEHRNCGDDNDDGGSCILSEQTINKIASGKEIDLSDLSLHERKAFLRAIASGEFSHMIKPWEPWWSNPFLKQMILNKEGNRLVQVLNSAHSDNSESENNRFDIPPPLDSPLPALQHLTPKPPSPLLGIHVAEILYSYCFTLRLYNGEWTYDAFDAAKTCLCVSHVLGQSSSPETIRESMNGCFETICSPLFKSMGGFKFALALLDDAAAILRSGRAGVICALSDLHRMLEKAVKDVKQGNDSKTMRRKAKSSSGLPQNNKPNDNKIHTTSLDLKNACRKVFFLLCWVNEQPDNVLSSLALLLETEKEHILDTYNESSYETGKKSMNDAVCKKVLVEELT